MYHQDRYGKIELDGIIPPLCQSRKHGITIVERRGMDMLSPLFERLLTVEFLGWAVAVTSLAYGVRSYGVLIEKQIKGNQETIDLLRQLVNEKTGMIERLFVLLDRIQTSIDDVRMKK